jgi:predicted ATPase
VTDEHSALSRSSRPGPTTYSNLERIIALEARMTRREDVAGAATGEHQVMRRDIERLESLVTDPERGLFAQLGALRGEVQQFRREVVVAVTIIVIVANFVVPYVIAALGGPR